MTRTLKAVLPLTLLLVLAPIPASSIFDDGLGDIADILNRIFDILQKIDQALPNPLAARYGPVWTPWLSRLPAQDIAGKNSLWRGVLSGASDDYLGAIKEGEKLLEIDPGALDAAPEIVEQVQRQIARIYRTDAISAYTLHNVVKVPLHADENDKQIYALQQDVLSPSPASKHVLAQLQLGNVASVHSLHISQDTNKLLTALSQHLLLESQARREGEVRGLNHQLEYMQRGLPIERELSQGAIEKLSQFRLP